MNFNFTDCLKMIHSASDSDDDSQVLHISAHIAYVSPLTESAVQFASSVALNPITHFNGSFARSQMQEFLCASARDPAAIVMRGQLFERHAIERLGQGGIFTCRGYVSLFIFSNWVH